MPSKIRIILSLRNNSNSICCADLTYYDALEIMNILKRTVEDAESKTLFGGYKVKSLKDWDEIIKAFGSNNVYLADAAQILVQIALYEM